MGMGQNPNRLAPSEHPNPTTKIGSKMGIGFDPQPYEVVLAQEVSLSLCFLFHTPRPPPPVDPSQQNPSEWVTSRELLI